MPNVRSGLARQMANLARAYGPDEPDYSATAIIEPNPHYRP